MITAGDLHAVPLFAPLPLALRTRIASRAGDLSVGAGEWIAHEGDPASFWVVLEGEIEAIRMVLGEAIQVTTFDPGEYVGEVPLMLGASSFAALRALRPCASRAWIQTTSTR